MCLTGYIAMFELVLKKTERKELQSAITMYVRYDVTCCWQGISCGIENPGTSIFFDYLTTLIKSTVRAKSLQLDIIR